MRVAIVFSCAVFVACAQKDQRSTVLTSTATVAPDTITPAVQSETVEKPWAPSPLPAPGDTTPQGFPTETALLRWVRRFPPDSFSDLSKPVRDTLVGRGCQIPTPGYRTNVITGAFTAKDIVQWAVICSVRDTSQILVLDAKNGVVIDGAFLPKPIDHDGIDQAFLDKASSTFYFAQGKWITVASSD